MIYIGIDPGATGGIAIIGEDGKLWTEGDLSVQEAAEVISRTVIDHHPLSIHAMLEDSNAFPGQSSVATACQFRNIGQWEGILVALGIPYQMVKAVTWQKLMLVGKPARDKGESKAINRKKIKAYAAVIAARTFPGNDFRRTIKSTTPHDGIVDAALIAEYCRRTWR